MALRVVLIGALRVVLIGALRVVLVRALRVMHLSMLLLAGHMSSELIILSSGRILSLFLIFLLHICVWRLSRAVAMILARVVQFLLWTLWLLSVVVLLTIGLPIMSV